MRPGYLQISHFSDRLGVNVWADKDCVGDLNDQADYRLDRVDGLRMEAVDIYLQRNVSTKVDLRLTVFVNGAEATYLALARDGIWDEYNDALDALRQITEEVNA